MTFRTQFRRLLSILGINAALLLLGAVMIELIFGNWFVGYVVPDPRLIDRTFNIPQQVYPPHDNVTYVRDRYGLRTSPHPVSSAQLVTIGGSTTAQTLISDGATWQDVIRQQSGIVTANAGVDGMSTQGVDSVLNDWLFQILELKAQHFLHYIGVNDAAMFQTTTIAERQPRYSWRRRIRGRSAILQSYSKLQAMLRGPHVVNHAAVKFAGVKMEPRPTYQPARLHADAGKVKSFVDTFYKSNLRYLLDLHRSKGHVAILVTQAANPGMVRREAGELVVMRSDLAQWAVALQTINAATREVCIAYREGCRLVDLAAELSFDREDFYDLVHNTPAGARKIGEYLAGKLSTMPDLGARR